MSFFVFFCLLVVRALLSRSLNGIPKGAILSRSVGIKPRRLPGYWQNFSARPIDQPFPRVFSYAWICSIWRLDPWAVARATEHGDYIENIVLSVMEYRATARAPMPR